MKITNNMQINFGKKAVATCNVTEATTKKVLPATVYEMDPFKVSDLREVRYSKNAGCILYDMEKISKCSYGDSSKEFYLLKVDKTGEVVACAETSHRYNRGNTLPQGQYTMVEEASENKKFTKGAFPLFAFIAQKASDRYDKNVISVVGSNEEPTLQKGLELKPTNFDGVYTLSKRRFGNYIKKAQEQTQFEVIG